MNQNSIDGGNGNDKIYGLQGNDFLSGLNGNDQIFGGDGNDQIFGDSGNDKIYGEGSSDKLLGGDGNDLLDGWYKSFQAGQIDELTGGKGSDTFVLGDKTDGVYYLGNGYAKIQDFRLSEGDKLQLTGNIKDYSISLGSSSSLSLGLNYKNDYC